MTSMLLGADNALRTLYLGVISERLNANVNPLLTQIKQSSSDIWGKEIRTLARYSDNDYEQFSLTLKNLYGTIEISDKAVRASEHNVGAFVNLLNAELEHLLRTASFNFSRMLFGDGSGILAKVSSIAERVIAVDSVKNFIEGMIVEFRFPNGELITSSSARRVLSIDRQNKTITITGASMNTIDVPAGSLIVAQGSYQKELTGLAAIFKDTGSLYEIDRTTNKWMVPYMKTEVGAISTAVIQKAIDEIEITSGSIINFIVCSHDVKRAYQKYLTDNNLNADILELDGGYKALSYNGIPLISDRFCPDGTMYLLNTNDFTLHQLCDWRWLEDERGKVLRQGILKPSYTATLVKYADLICSRPIGQGMLTGIVE